MMQTFSVMPQDGCPVCAHAIRTVLYAVCGAVVGSIPRIWANIGWKISAQVSGVSALEMSVCPFGKVVWDIGYTEEMFNDQPFRICACKRMARNLQEWTREIPSNSLKIIDHFVATFECDWHGEISIDSRSIPPEMLQAYSYPPPVWKSSSQPCEPISQPKIHTGPIAERSGRGSDDRPI